MFNTGVWPWRTVYRNLQYQHRLTQLYIQCKKLGQWYTNHPFALQDHFPKMHFLRSLWCETDKSRVILFKEAETGLGLYSALTKVFSSLLKHLLKTIGRFSIRLKVLLAILLSVIYWLTGSKMFSFFLNWKTSQG